MNFPLTVVTLAGSVALLLWGVRMVQTGVQRAFVSHLYAESPGGHDWPYWTRTLEDSLIFFGDVLRGRE